MRKYCILLLMFSMFCNLVLSQSSERIIMGQDSTLDLYFSHSLEKKIIGDSCISGMYFLKFSVDKKGNINNYDYSQLMPLAFEAEIKTLLDGIKEKWDKKFIKLVAKKNKIIIQPVFLHIDNNCSINPSLLEKLNFDSSDKEAKQVIALKNATMILLSSYIINVQKTYIDAFDFGGNSFSYMNCVLLKPCLIIRNIPGKKIKM
jgi:hypothetical protein